MEIIVLKHSDSGAHNSMVIRLHSVFGPDLGNAVPPPVNKLGGLNRLSQQNQSGTVVEDGYKILNSDHSL